MASHCQKKRKRHGDDSNGCSTRLWTYISSVPWMGIVVGVGMLLLLLDMRVEAAPVSVTTLSMVVFKTSLSGPCMDSSGNVYNDLEEWTDGCTRVVCHVEPSGNYTVTHGCRDLVDSENPDVANCYTVVNTSATIPGCCPYLQCGSAPQYSTLNPSLCVDYSSYNTCSIWKELSANCTLTTSLSYNFSLDYCKATCGFCSGAVG